MGGLVTKHPSLPKVGKGGSFEHQATFAAGCFWGVEKMFKEHFKTGIVSTRVGYTGGHSKAPNFQQVSAGTTGHAEALHIYFNPNQVEYKDLVRYFFRMHDPTTLNKQGNDIGRQFRSAIFYYTPHQKKIAEEVKHDVRVMFKQPIVTEIVPAGAFYDAEEEHQDYFVKNPNLLPQCTHKRLYW